MLPTVCREAMSSSLMVTPVASSMAIISSTAARESAPRSLSVASGFTASASQPSVSTMTFFTVSNSIMMNSPSQIVSINLSKLF